MWTIDFWVNLDTFEKNIVKNYSYKGFMLLCKNDSFRKMKHLVEVDWSKTKISIDINKQVKMAALMFLHFQLFVSISCFCWTYAWFLNSKIFRTCRKWRGFCYQPRAIKFAREKETSQEKDVTASRNLPQFSSAAVPKVCADVISTTQP